MIVFCDLYSSLPINNIAVTQALLDAIRNQLAARCFCTAANRISSLTIASDYATGEFADISISCDSLAFCNQRVFSVLIALCTLSAVFDSV